MMKKTWMIAGCVTVVAFLVSCNDVRRSPGRAYMPDMGESRAYESYASTENLKQKGIRYNAKPVPGTIARGDMPAYDVPNDLMGYDRSASIKNPLDSSQTNMAEAERLYMINCAICHGAKLDGNGPLWNNGDGPYTVAPRNLLDDYSKALSVGTIFHVETYGKGQMGSYASQLTTQQRWEVAAWIKSKQAGSAAQKPAATTDSTSMKP